MRNNTSQFIPSLRGEAEAIQNVFRCIWIAVLPPLYGRNQRVQPRGGITLCIYWLFPRWIASLSLAMTAVVLR